MEHKVISNNFRQIFFNEMNKLNQGFSDYIFLCIGTTKVTGDAFGPFVGYYLLDYLQYQKHIHVIGHIEKTVSYLNIEQKIEQIYHRFSSPYIIAIDSALATEKDIGKIILSNTKLQLGKSLGKNKYQLGDMAIKGVVAKNYHKPISNFKVLQHTPKAFVSRLAKITAQNISEVVNTMS